MRILLTLVALAVAACATESQVPEPDAADVALLLEVNVWADRADLPATKAFYESFGLTVTQSVSEDGPFRIYNLEVDAGATTLRITFVPHEEPYSPWDSEPTVPAGLEEPDYPQCTPTWLICVKPERFEELRAIQGAHAYRLDGREYIGLQDPSGLKVRVRTQ